MIPPATHPSAPTDDADVATTGGGGAGGGGADAVDFRTDPKISPTAKSAITQLRNVMNAPATQLKW